MKRNLNLQAQKTGLLSFCFVFLLSTFLPQVGLYRLPTNDEETLAKIDENYGKIPLTFEQNVGQTDEQVKFLNRAGNTTTYFTPTETVMVKSQDIGDEDNSKLVSDVLRMSLNGANDNPEITGLEEQQTKSNYFVGNNSDDWQSDIINYGKIKYSEVYPGIDMVYYGNNDNLEHDFVVSPGTDPNQISISLKGAKNLKIDERGDLIVKQAYGETILSRPVTYQKDSQVESNYRLEGDIIKIALGEYDHSKELIIDPVVVYSTYLGGSSTEQNVSLVLDASGNAYVYGITNSTDFPTTGAYQGSLSGANDYFISKISQDGSTLVYSTYLGGTGSEVGPILKVDLNGNLYLGGSTQSTDFPTVNPYQASKSTGTDATFTKIDSSGTSLIYSSYLGGNGTDAIHGIDVNVSGNAYLAGSTSSSNFPTASALDGTLGGGQDAFLTKVSIDGSSLEFSTYFGGTGGELAEGLILDSNLQPYIYGYTDSTNLTTSSPYQASNAGGSDGFITKFSDDGVSVDYSTYIGGSGTDIIYDLDFDSTNNIYISGFSSSSDYPTSSPYQASNAGGNDAILTKFNSSGSAIVYSTYIGGAGSDVAYSVRVDSNDNPYVAGFTTSSDYPTSFALQDSLNGASDLVVTKFNSSGSSLVYSTYFGGSSTDGPGPHAADMSLDDNFYIAGGTTSSDFPVTNAYQSTLSGGTDVFVVQLTEHSVVVTGQVNPTLTFTVDDTSCDLGVISATSTGSCTHTMTAGTNASSGYAISYLPTSTLTSGADTITETGTTGATSSQGSEQFGLNLKDNATPNIGAEALGGVGVASTNYNNADTFSFTTSGAQVAQSTTLSDTTTYTVSYIANVANTTEAGNYSTVQTYNIVASY